MIYGCANQFWAAPGTAKSADGSYGTKSINPALGPEGRRGGSGLGDFSRELHSREQLLKSRIAPEILEFCFDRDTWRPGRMQITRTVECLKHFVCLFEPGVNHGIHVGIDKFPSALALP